LSTVVAQPGENVANTRFRGFPSDTPQVLAELARTPAERWSGTERATYAARLLAPLKALCRDVGERLAEADPPLTSEARVGGSLVTARGENSPACGIRFWDSERKREKSPLLFVELGCRAIEIGLREAEEEAGGTGRLRRALLAERPLRSHAVALPASGWRVEGVPLTDAGDGAVPDELRPWMLGGGFRASLALPWEDWADEPALVDEIADRLREVLPLFDAMRGADPVVTPGS
jgi:hypothetical protein